MLVRVRAFALVSVAVAMGCRPAPPVDQPNDPEVPADPIPMAEHFLEVVRIKDAVIAGKLDDTRKPAQWLLDNVVAEDLPVRWRPYVPPVHRAAKAVLAAQTLVEAGTAAADLGAACGGCHDGMALDLRPSEAPEPLQDNTKFAQMMRHAWGADRMWDGLVGPNDDAWIEGVEVLREAPLHGDAAPEPVKGLAERVHAISHTAADARDLDARAEVYAELVSTCATCHQKSKDLAAEAPDEAG